MKKLAIFASGTGSNAEKIINYFKADSPSVAKVSLVLSNKSDAGVLTIARNNRIPTIIFTRDEFYKTNTILQQLQKVNIDMIVLAGFLWLIPDYLLKSFPNKIINIHPALLPKYGGKGMYENRVHQAVIAAGEKESGISIHYVNEHYDEGQIIFQAKCEVTREDTPETLVKKIHKLEHEHFSKIIETLLYL